MTIKARNRITLIFSITTTFFFVLILLTFVFQVLTGRLSCPNVYMKDTSKIFLLAYNSKCVFISIFLQYFYVIFTSFMIYRSFEKTQANDMLFFLIFLLAFFFDTSRILIPLFKISGTYSEFLIKIGNLSLFARLLAPLALFGTTVLSSDELNQNVNYNILLLIMSALFFSIFIPTNNTIIYPNFCLSYGYTRLIRVLSFFVCLASSVTIFITSLKNEYKLKMAIGFTLICIGYAIFFNSYSILSTIAGPLILGTGTWFYLSEVHNHYLWID